MKRKLGIFFIVLGILSIIYAVYAISKGWKDETGTYGGLAVGVMLVVAGWVMKKPGARR